MWKKEYHLLCLCFESLWVGGMCCYWVAFSICFQSVSESHENELFECFSLFSMLLLRAKLFFPLAASARISSTRHTLENNAIFFRRAVFFCVVSSWLFNSIAAGANAIRRNVSYEWEFLLLFFFIIERCFTFSSDTSSALAKVLRNLCATEQLRFRIGFCCLQARKTRFTRCLIDTQCNAASATDERTIVEQ